MRSDIEGFYKKSIKERVDLLKKETNIEDFDALTKVKKEQLDRMSENVVGGFILPFSIATNFKINEKDYLVPMVTEEPSVVAAASKAAKLARASGGFHAEADEPVMIGQIQLVDIENFNDAENKIKENEHELIELANSRDSILIKFGGGAKNIDVKRFDNILVVYLYVDVRDAMGANAVNTMCEFVAKRLEDITGGRARLRIITNLATERKARARAIWKAEILGNGDVEKGKQIVDSILESYALAKKDIYRTVTHNKGIMNGIDAVVLATGNDFRAIEAGAHGYASLNGYHPLTKYSKTVDGDLIGEIELPLAVGVVGGATRSHPTARLSIEILNVKTAQELAMVIASVGLAQNFAALLALSTEGIQRGHMRLHAKNIATQAGAKENEIDDVVKKMIESNDISEHNARGIIEELRK